VATLAHLPQAAFRTMAWKNGGGETAEIAIYPPAARLDNFVWRVSRATVHQSGPFSQFPGIDRTLCVLEGTGIDLAFSEGGKTTLDPDSSPYQFAGELHVEGSVVAPGLVDFNAMTRRSAARHHVVRRPIVGKIDIGAPGDFLLVYASQVPLVASCGEVSRALARGDALLVAEAMGQTVSLAAQTHGSILTVDIWLA
jgi:uncharacterized protein